MKKILVTGAAGFIGFHLAKRLIEDENFEVHGLDNLNDYYDINLKNARLDILKDQGINFHKMDLTEKDKVLSLFDENKFDYIIHLAAQAGVRYSLEAPFQYTESNITGFLSILEACRKYIPEHLIFASTSSIYGLNTNMPFSVHHSTDHPVSLYAATKKANEMMAHSYSHLYGIPSTGLRFFTVYGPWGRPDMALFKFTKAILEGKPIDVYNFGKMKRDFTYIDDIVESILKLIHKSPVKNNSWDSSNPDPAASTAPYRIFNIGSNNPVDLMDFIQTLEMVIGKEAKKNLLPMQPGDVEGTYADVDDLIETIDYQPSTTIKTGISEFVKWYRDFYQV